MRSETLRVLRESHIAQARPTGTTVAAACLAVAGILVIPMSTIFVLTGLFVGNPVLWIGCGIVGFGACCFVLSFGLRRGYLWAWFNTLLLAVPSIVFAWWISGAGSETLIVLSRFSIILHIVIQFMLWKRAVRNWFFLAHHLRSRGAAGLVLPLDAAAIDCG